MGKLQQEVQQEVGVLKAGQEQMLARLERVLAAVEKLEAASSIKRARRWTGGDQRLSVEQKVC